MLNQKQIHVNVGLVLFKLIFVGSHIIFFCHKVSFYCLTFHLSFVFKFFALFACLNGHLFTFVSLF